MPSGQRGPARALTADQARRLRAAAADVAPRPPWTAHSRAAADRFRALLDAAHGDGVSVTALASCLGWTPARVRHHLTAAGAGTATASRRRAPSRRGVLAAAERARLRARYADLPVRGIGRDWTGPAGQRLRADLAAHRASGVPTAALAQALGVSRQAVAAVLTGRGPRSADRAGLSAATTRRLRALYAALPCGRAGSRRWSTPQGVALAGYVRGLADDGVTTSTAAAALGLAPSVLGRMLAVLPDAG